MNSLQLASKDIHDILKRTACFPWPEAVRFFNQAYAKRILFSPDGKWLVYGDMNGVLTIWDRHKGKRTEAQSSCEWISLMAISSSSTWLACGNSIDDTISLFHLPAGTWHTPVKCSNNMRAMVFAHDTICAATNLGIMILDVNKRDVGGGDDEWTCGGNATPFQMLYEGRFKFMAPVHWVEPILAASDSDHRVHLWALGKVDGHRILCHADTIDEGHRYVVAMSSVGDGNPNGYLAIAGWCLATRSSFIDLWSCTESIVMQRIPIDHKIHVSSLVMVSQTSWIIADGAIDQVRIWRNYEHFARCTANPTRMDFSVYKSTISWIGRGSTLWLRDLNTLAD